MSHPPPDDLPPHRSPISSDLTPYNEGGFSRGFWTVIIGFALVLGGLEIYASTELTREAEAIITQQSESEQATLSNAPAKVNIKRELIELTFKRGEEKYRLTHTMISEEIKQTFQNLRTDSEPLVKSWAEWYFSVTGEYVRLAKFITQQMGRGQVEDYMLKQVRERLFDPLQVGEKLSRLDSSVQKKMQIAHSETSKWINDRLNAALAEAESRGEVADEDLKYYSRQQEALLKLDHFSTTTPLAITSKLLSVTGVSLALKAGAGLAAKGVIAGGGKVGAKVVSQKAGVKAGAKIGQAMVTKVASKGLLKSAVALWSKLLIKFGVKAAAKGGGALAAGATSAVACSPLGPVAFLCGAGAAVVTWFAVDKIVVEVDEYFNRDEFEADLKRDLNATWSEVEAEMLASVDAHFKRLQILIRRRASTPASDAQPTRLIDHLPQNK